MASALRLELTLQVRQRFVHAALFSGLIWLAVLLSLVIVSLAVPDTANAAASVSWAAHSAMFMVISALSDFVWVSLETIGGRAL